MASTKLDRSVLIITFVIAACSALAGLANRTNRLEAGVQYLKAENRSLLRSCVVKDKIIKGLEEMIHEGHSGSSVPGAPCRHRIDRGVVAEAR